MTRYRYYACGIESPHLKSRDLSLTEGLSVTADTTLDGDVDISGDLTSVSIPSFSAVQPAINSSGPLSNTGSQMGAIFTTPTGTKNIKTALMIDISFHTNNSTAAIYTLPFTLKYDSGGGVYVTAHSFEGKQYMHDQSQHTNICVMTTTSLAPGVDHIVHYDGNVDIDVDSNDIFSIMIMYLGYD